jgi:hypothetical protein
MIKHLNEELTKTLILDGTKIQWYADRVKKWENGEKIAPVTIDMALTRSLVSTKRKLKLSNIGKSISSKYFKKNKSIYFCDGVFIPAFFSQQYNSTFILK